MDEIVEAPEFEMSPRTVAALRRRGGNLYIWMDRVGLLRARASPPVELFTYNTLFREGCSIHIQGDLDPAGLWVVRWKLLPWPHFRVFYDPDPPTGTAVGGLLDGIFEAPWP